MDAGINTLDDLANADAGSLAEKLDVIGGQATVENRPEGGARVTIVLRAPA